MDAALVRGAMPIFIPAHAVVSGFVYTHADGGLKFLNVGLFAPGKSWRFRFIVRIPGHEYAVQRVDFRGLYAPGQIEDLILEQLLRSAGVAVERAGRCGQLVAHDEGDGVRPADAII